MSAQESEDFNRKINPDQRPVGFGKYADVRLCDVPEAYCIWMWENTRDNGTNNEVRRRGAKIKEKRRKAAQVQGELVL